MTIGQSIKTARIKAGLTQKQLAEKSGIATITLQQYERDVREPKLVTIAKIARSLDLYASDLINDRWRDVSGDPTDDSEILAYANDEHQRLTKAFCMLNREGQKKAVERVQELTEIPRYRAESPAQGQQQPAGPEADKDPTHE